MILQNLRCRFLCGWQNMYTRQIAKICKVALLASFILAIAVTDTRAAKELSDPASLQKIVAAVCSVKERNAANVAGQLGGAKLVDETRTKFRDTMQRIRKTFRISSGNEIRSTSIRRDGTLMRFVVEVYQKFDGQKLRPDSLAIADGTCLTINGRRITYDSTGRANELIFLSSTLDTTESREPLNPPIPTGDDPSGVTVALIDSGISYGLPIFANILARDDSGMALGYDYWDMDTRPYDVDTSRSMFFPRHHGTRMASVLLQEAPGIRLIPYRYPRPDMTRMRDLIADADAKGTKVVAMAMGSNQSNDWTAFEQAARTRPHMLFVISAGNNGRNIDERAVYPATLRLKNSIVVTSSYRDGRLAEGSNWGSRSVDLMLPAEELEAIDHRGKNTLVSGSSFAVARIAALAARLLAEHPNWAASELKRAIIDRARTSGTYEKGTVQYGWIPDPQADE